jgi:hypothetical protein
LAYAAGLHGAFQFDDLHNIVYNPMLRSLGTPAQNWLAVALSSDAGMLRRPVSMLSFGLNVWFFGMGPFAFKAVNLAIHLANGALVYAIGRRIAARLSPSSSVQTQNEMIALVAAALWLLHPLHVSAVLYVVQRMNELSALFTLAGLLCYVESRNRMLEGQDGLRQGIMGLCAFGLLAVFSKENGALIFLYALIVEFFCYRFEAPTDTDRRTIKAFFVLTLAAPALLAAAYLMLHPQWLQVSYSVRDFTLSQRLLTEGRILWHYLLWIVLPNPAWMGIFHDDIATSTDLFEPASNLIAALGLVVLCVVAWKLRNRARGVAFSIAWFLAGHVMESSILPLELVFEHRNYLPMVGLILGITCSLAPGVAANGTRIRVALGAFASMSIVLAGLTAARASTWGSPLDLALTDASHHPLSARSQYEAGRMIIVSGEMKGERARADLEAESYFRHAAELDPREVAPLSELILIEAARGPVDKPLLDDLARRLREAHLYTKANAFFSMLHAASLSKLSLVPSDFAALTEAALANPRYPPKVRAMIMNDYGAYRFNIAHDSQDAIVWTLAAAAEDPKNPYFQINLATIALTVTPPDKAKAAQFLESARRLNTVGVYDKEIAELQRKLGP